MSSSSVCLPHLSRSRSVFSCPSLTHRTISQPSVSPSIITGRFFIMNSSQNLPEPQPLPSSPSSSQPPPPSSVLPHLFFSPLRWQILHVQARNSLFLLLLQAFQLGFQVAGDNFRAGKSFCALAMSLRRRVGRRSRRRRGGAEETLQSVHNSLRKLRRKRAFVRHSLQLLHHR